MNDFDALAQYIIKGKAPDCESLVQEMVDSGISPSTIMDEGLIKGMNVIGIRFRNNEVYVPEVLIAARAMKAGMKVLKPLLAEANVQPVGTLVLGTVRGDLHDIGKNLVGMMMEGAGIEVIDLGIDTAPEKFVEAIKEKKPTLVGLSALLTTTMPAMGDTVQAIDESGLRDTVKILIGGAPVTQGFCDEIGADAYGKDAATAVDIALECFKS
jgi:5-methyltetrahydrofolate--homocysteine methyltransferase